MDTVLTLRKRGRPPGHKQFTERLPSVLATPTDVENWPISSPRAT